MDLFTKPCSSCGAPVRWITTEHGSAHPLNAKPEKRWIIDRNDVGRVVDVFVSHFATCPSAFDHRRNQ